MTEQVNENKQTADRTTESFRFLLSSLAFSAMQHMGRAKNPFTGKSTKNLPAAQEIIDLIDTIEIKTKGNLTEHEIRMLSAVGSDLKLNYFEASSEVEKDAQEPKPEGTDSAQASS